MRPENRKSFALEQTTGRLKEIEEKMCVKENTQTFALLCTL